ncbi:hypothetical protein JCM10212_004500 [Sporobolomyces blumeae]
MEPPDDLPDSDYATTAPATTNVDPGVAVGRDTQQDGQPLAPFDYLSTLNPAQKEAVTAGTEGGLQILAGPGSGKTAVLTRRVAWLVQHDGIEPDRLVVVTFTNKAANEMKHRLSKILGPKETERVVMGTFHSTCVRYLRQYAKLVGLASNFVIADRDDCLAMLKRIVNTVELPPGIEAGDIKPAVYLDHISKCKARMISPGLYRLEHRDEVDKSKHEAIASVYEAYEDELEKANSLDFDDLLLRGHKLFSRHPRVVARIQSVLIDEFQDTNTVQYDLVKLIARASGSLTIVGDPDQSIYGWRNAEVENLDKMMNDFQPCRQIFLEQNYRSTGAILGAALAVVRQDTNRINKSLHSSHPSGSSVVLYSASDAENEATFIASTIRHLVAHLGGLVTYNDFAILLRYGALSRSIETGLQKAKVPNRMVGGHKFFERAEVKDCLSYLQLLSNPSYTPALQRVLNVPRRSLGDRTQKDIFEHASRTKTTPFEVLVKVANGSSGVTVTQAQRKAIQGFVKVVRAGRNKADEGCDVRGLIDFVTERTNYRAYLTKTYGTDCDERWENVLELQNYATVVANENPADVELKTEGQGEREEEMEEVEISRPTEEKVEEGEDESEVADIIVPLASQAASSDKTTPLEVFLATSMLATDTETTAAVEEGKADKVTISTCHAAKGLEWPIVFIPACEEGVYPFFRATADDEIDEERRLLYVAITRAQSFCFVSHASIRLAAGKKQRKAVTPFLATVSTTYPTLFVKKMQKISEKTRQTMAQVIGRPAPSEDEAKRRIKEFEESGVEIPAPVTSQQVEKMIREAEGQAGSRYSGQGSFGSYGRFSNNRGGFSSQSSFSNSGRWSNTPNFPSSQPVPAGGGGFQTARTLVAPSASQPGTGGIDAASAPRDSKTPTTRRATSPPAYAAPNADAAVQTDVRSTSAAFKPLRPARNPSATFHPPRYLAPRPPPDSASASTYVPPTKSVPSAATNGPPPTVETRASMIRDAVLVNPVLTAPKTNPSTQRDLLASFQQAESRLLDDMRGLGGSDPTGEGREGGKGKATEIDLTLDSDDLPPPAELLDNLKRPPMSPKRKTKRSKR